MFYFSAKIINLCHNVITCSNYLKQRTYDIEFRLISSYTDNSELMIIFNNLAEQQFTRSIKSIFFNDELLWFRCILSTALGELVFSIIWSVIFFRGKLSQDMISSIVVNQYIFKVIFEIITLPITYLIVYFLNKFELKTKIKYNFTPVHLKNQE